MCVAVVRSYGSGETEFNTYRPYQCPIPHVLKEHVMRSKAAAFCDGYYVKAWEDSQTKARWHDWMEEDGRATHSYRQGTYNRAITPPYAEIRSRIVDGDGFDDEPLSGDYLRACRIALEVGR